MTFYNAFHSFHPKIQEALKILGFTKPTEPQERAFPHIMDRKTRSFDSSYRFWQDRISCTACFSQHPEKEA